MSESVWSEIEKNKFIGRLYISSGYISDISKSYIGLDVLKPFIDKLESENAELKQLFERAIDGKDVYENNATGYIEYCEGKKKFQELGKLDDFWLVPKKELKK